MKRILFLILVIMLMACGKEDCSNNTTNPCPAPDTSAEADFTLRGSVVGAFEVEVDGTTYDDLESFYSAEVVRIQLSAIDAGFPSYKATLDAEIGFQDLTQGMAVFVAPVTNRGYAAKTKVAQDDTFTLHFPEDASNDVYQIKAVKRVSIKLVDTLSEEVLLWCYNFSAVESQVSWEDVDKPIVLTSFETKLTAYACEDTSSDNSFQTPGSN